jgi:flavin-binding protein dodecin
MAAVPHDVTVSASEGDDPQMSVYKVIEVIGTSSQSWEDAATSAIKTARETLRDLRVAQVVEQDMDIGEGDAITFRTKVRVSFKYEGES